MKDFVRNDASIKLVRLTEEFWNERKGLDYQQGLKPFEKKRIIARLKKLVEQIKALDWEEEFKILEAFI